MPVSGMPKGWGHGRPRQRRREDEGQANRQAIFGQTLSRVVVVLGVAALLSSCDDVKELQATVGLVDRSCALPPGPPPWTLYSIRIEAIEWYGGEPGNVRSSECLEIDEGLPVGHPQDLLDWFGSGGLPVIDGLPTDIPQRVQLIGFQTASCEMLVDPWGPLVCGISQDTLSESSFTDGDDTRFTFSCVRDPDQPEVPTGLYGLCLGVGTDLFAQD